MIAKGMQKLVSGSSLIRAMFEEGKRLQSIHGIENVYDFSLGNPNVEPPKEIGQAINDILATEPPNYVHGYMNNSGYEDVRSRIAESLNTKFGTNYTQSGIVMTVGAAGALNVAFKTLLDPGDEVIVFAPYFGEYNNYVGNFNGNLVVVPADVENFQINLEAFESSVTSRTKAVIINSPNNPSGVIYTEATIKALAEILERKQSEHNNSIYLISDEPYRSLVFDNIDVPYVSKYYRNSFVAYSFSKALSLPGERIGYLAVSNEVDSYEDIRAGLNVANRILGYVNAPSLFQRVVVRCLDMTVDMSSYRANRDALYNHLTALGFKCLKPQGAFYMFPKALIDDDKKFCEAAKKYNLLIVPGSAFSCPGHFRIAFCVKEDMVTRSLPAFEKLAKEFI